MKKLLVICPIGLGNFIMATPALVGLREYVGSSQLSILALKGGIREMAEASGWFGGGVYFWDPDKQDLGTGMRLLRQLRKEKFDLSLSLFPTGHWKFALFSFLIGSKERAGFKYPGPNLANWINTKYCNYRPELHDVDQNINLILNALNTKLDYPQNVVFPLIKNQDNVVEGKPLNSFSYFVCHPGSSEERGMTKKRVPLTTLIPILEELCVTFELKCMILGGPEEKPLKTAISHILGEKVAEADTANMAELGEVISQGAFFIGNDSGLMHIAEALGKKCIVFFGPSSEKRTGPYIPPPERREGIPRKHLIIRNPKDDLSRITSYNPKLLYENHHGLQDLKPEDCLDKIKDFLCKLV